MDYDMPICKQHIKVMEAKFFELKVVVVAAIGFAFISGFVFCKMIGG
jgi:hypothetical protein